MNRLCTRTPLRPGATATLSPRVASVGGRRQILPLTAAWPSRPGARSAAPFITALGHRSLPQRQLVLAAVSPTDADGAHAPAPHDDGAASPSSSSTPEGAQASSSAARAAAAAATAADKAAAVADKAATLAAAAAVEKAGIAEHMDKAAKLIDEILEEIMRELFAEQVRVDLATRSGLRSASLKLPCIQAFTVRACLLVGCQRQRACPPSKESRPGPPSIL